MRATKIHLSATELRRGDTEITEKISTLLCEPL